MYKIKEKLEDFIVTEQSTIELNDSGEFVYFTLMKKGFNTISVIDKISRFLHIPVKNIGFAGAKDKNAITTQMISIKDPRQNIDSSKFDKFNSDNIQMKYVGRGKKPISLGSLKGNSFEITLKNCSKIPHEINKMINYFDDQRFSNTNADVGKAIVKKDFKKACNLISDDKVSSALEKNPTDYVGAMKKLPLKIRTLHLHAYQSWLWNRVVNKIIGETGKCITYSLGELNVGETPDRRVDIIGFGTEVDEISAEILKEEKINSRDFIINSMPEISVEGGGRDVTVPVENLNIKKMNDDSYLIKFTLPKGCYATMAIKQMFC